MISAPSRTRLRRWYTAVAGLLAACAVIVAVAQQPQVHIAKAEVTFLPPASVVETTPYQGYVETIIAFAGTVSGVYNQRYPSTMLSSPRATLFGNGLRQGISVHPSMTGNQWRVGFDRPVIVVTVSAPTEEGALVTLHQAIGRIEGISVRLQDDEDVAPSMRIGTVWHEQEIRVDSFGPTRESTVKGAVVLMVIALLCSAVVTTALDRRLVGGPGPDPVHTTAPHPIRAQVRR